MTYKNKRIYIVCWEFDTGCGFWWYTSRAQANDAFKEEHADAGLPINRKAHYKAGMFPYRVKHAQTRVQVTNEVEQMIWRLPFSEMIEEQKGSILE